MICEFLPNWVQRRSQRRTRKHSHSREVDDNRQENPVVCECCDPRRNFVFCRRSCFGKQSLLSLARTQFCSAVGLIVNCGAAFAAQARPAVSGVGSATKRLQSGVGSQASPSSTLTQDSLFPTVRFVLCSGFAQL